MINDHGATAILDALTPASWGGARAGRAETLARSMGDKHIPFTVKNPQWSATLGSFAGLGLGSALGLGGSILAGAGGDGITNSVTAGAAGGSLLGGILAGLIRRKHIKEIAERFDDHEGNLTPTMRKSRIFGMAPAHARGREEVFRALAEGDSSPEVAGSTTANVLDMASRIPYAGLAASPVYMATAPFLQQNSNDRVHQTIAKDAA